MPAWPASPALLLVPSAALFNIVLTFWGALALTLLAARCVPSPAARKLLLLVPFIKLAADLCAGIPADNYTFSAFAGTRWDLGRFAAGFGWDASSQLIPALELRLGALRAGQWHSLSGGDVIANALYRRQGWPVLMLLLAGCATVAVLRSYRRVRAWRDFHRQLPIGAPTFRLGRIAVRRSRSAACDAFTAGVLQPTIWLPQRGSGLRPAELRAILRHELAHVRHGDVLLFAALGVLRDLLWFVPGVPLLVRCVHDAAERSADAAAVRGGADPLALASALVSVADRRLTHAVVASVAGSSSVEGRIHALLAPRVRLPLTRIPLFLIGLTLALVALGSSFFGFR